MKKKFLAFTFLVTAELLAQNQAQTNSKNIQAESACNAKCPSGDYIPAFYGQRNDHGVSTSVDFLYWYARETNLSYAAKMLSVEKSPPNATLILGQQLMLATRKFEQFDAKWKPGFRVGIGKDLGCKGLDINLNWTYYHNKSRESISVPDFGGFQDDPLFPGGFNPFFPAKGQNALVNPWVTLFFDGLNAVQPYFDHISAKWMLNFNQIDLEFGGKYWLGKSFAFRPYGGLRGAWIKTNFNTTSSRNFTLAGTNQDFLYKDRFTTDIWGLGILAGIQPTWYFVPNFSLFSNLSGALLWGNFKDRKKEHYTYTTTNVSTVGIAPFDYSNQSNNDFSTMQAALDLEIGLRWEMMWDCNRYFTTLDLGWENHIWFDVNHRNKLAGFSHPGIFQQGQTLIEGNAYYAEASGNLVMGGLVARFKLDF